jgi:hypothetical protein
MQPLTVADVRPPASYEPVRADARRQVIDLKKHRRVALGDLVTLVFENRETVRGVVEELLRAERVDDPERIAEELAVFNDLIPGDNELSATLFLEVTDAAELARWLSSLGGIESTVRMEVDGVPVESIFEEGRSRDDRTSSVHYLRFRLDEGQRASFLRGGPVRIVAEHDAYRAGTVLTEEQRSALAADLLGR